MVTFGYAAFFIGPAVVGFLVNRLGIQHAMAIPALLCVGIVLARPCRETTWAPASKGARPRGSRGIRPPPRLRIGHCPASISRPRDCGLRPHAKSSHLDSGCDGQPTRDEVDTIVEAWRRERPDLELPPWRCFLGSAGWPGTWTGSANAFSAHDLESWEFDVLAALRRAGPPYRSRPVSC